MGACYNEMTLNGECSKNEVIAKFNERVDQDGYESGHSYSGSFSQFSGLVFHDKLFNTRDEASDYVDEHSEKWGPAVCVRYKYAKPTKRIIAHSEAIRKMNEQVSEVLREVNSARLKMRINNRSTKPAYVIKAEERVERVRESVQPKIDERTEKMAAIYQKLCAKSKDIRWYLGGWCSS